MYLHLTTGTEDFLQKLKDKHSNEPLILASNVQKSILLSTSESKKNIFQMPQTFDIVDQTTKDAPQKLISLHRFHLDKDNQSAIEFHLKNTFSEICNRYEPASSFLLLEKKNKSIMIMIFWSEELTYKQFQASIPYEKMLEVKKHYSVKDGAFFTPYIEQSYLIVK